MGKFTPAMDETYLRYADLLFQHQQLLATGREEADETTAVEDELMTVWEELDAVQRQSLSGLGSDLNWVRRGGVAAPRAGSRGDVSPEELQRLRMIEGSGDWHRLLHQLRVCAPALPISRLASLRAAAWSALGQPRIAAVFSDFARRAGAA
jgi:hypothetical protein